MSSTSNALRAPSRNGWQGLIVGIVCAWLAHQFVAQSGPLPGAPAGPQATGDAAAPRSGWWRRARGGSAGPKGEPHVPSNFVRAEPTLERARSRWEKTLEWRREEGVDSILTEPNRVFHALKKHYPHYLHLPDKEGHLTYWELPGRLDMAALKKLSIDAKTGYRHYVWHTEYTWQMAAPKEGAQATVLFDAAGFGWDQLSWELIDLIKRIVSFTNQHYPHRAARIIVLNTPSWYNALHAMLKPIMSDVCETKLIFLSAVQVQAGALAQWIDPANLPVQYGGRSKVPLGESKHEKAMRAFADKANRRAGVKAVQPLSD